MDKVVIKAYIDLINYPYFIVVDIIEKKRYIRVVNYYNSRIGLGYRYIRVI